MAHHNVYVKFSTHAPVGLRTHVLVGSKWTQTLFVVADVLAVYCAKALLANTPFKLTIAIRQREGYVVQGYTFQEVLRRTDNGRGTVVLAGIRDEDEQPVVLKVSGHMSHLNELSCLDKLRECQHVPNVLCRNILEDNERRSFFIMSPRGRHLEPATDKLLGCLHVFRDVSIAINAAHSKSLIHGDISYLNTVKHNGIGLLLDWHVATPIPCVNSIRELTGTRLFLAANIHLGLCTMKKLRINSLE